MAKGMTTPMSTLLRSKTLGGRTTTGTRTATPTYTPTVRTRPTRTPTAPQPKQVYNQDVNANLREAVLRGNEENTRTINRFEGTARGLANQFNRDSSRLNNHMNNAMNNAYMNYDQRSRDILGKMGTASKETLGRMRGQAFAGLDSGFGAATDELKASMAARGLGNSGLFVRGLTDIANQRMLAGSAASTNAYGQAITADDNTRAKLLTGEGDLYGARQANLQGVHSRNMSQLGQNYGNRMGIEGQIMQNQINNTQQRQANLMGYAQLGRGMSGMAQNYLAQAGQGYQNIGQIAGQSAAQQGQLNNAYNSAKWNADANSAAGKGSMAGSAMGAAAMFSDMRLKKNVKALCKINGFQICTWDWNEEGIRVTGGNAPTVGVIAQEAAKIDPTAVRENKETGYLMVDYNKIFTGVSNG